jgi:hypothetical protein
MTFSWPSGPGCYLFGDGHAHLIAASNWQRKAALERGFEGHDKGPACDLRRCVVTQPGLASFPGRGVDRCHPQSEAGQGKRYHHNLVEASTRADAGG